MESRTTVAPAASSQDGEADAHAPAHCGHAHHHHHATTPHSSGKVLISARGLALSRGGRTILEDVDFEIREKEIVTLIGPNGAGKTSLVRVLLGLMAPDRGRVQKSLGLTIGYVPQRFDIDRTIPITVARFLALGGARSPARAKAVLEEVGASRVINQQLSGLSGGEIQRVLLARALLRNPGLLVLDEPVRGVDYVGEAELYALIDRLRDERGLGVLLVSHDLHIVMAQSDRVVCINRHVCCSGVPETVAKDPSYVRLFGEHAARSFAVYSHHHDHRHDLTGEPKPVSLDRAGSEEQGGVA